jgi:membrane protein DedA with SNARE-associated domain
MIETLYTTFITWIESDVVLLGACAAWLAAFFTGEGGGILVLAYALEGTIDTSVALVFIFLGSLSADMFWYLVTASTLRPWFEKYFKKASVKEPKKVSLPVLEYAKRHPYSVLLLIKFLVGLRLVLTIYIAARKDIPFGKYFVCNIIANILFVAALYGIALSVHATLGNTLDIKNNISHAITLVVIVVVGSQIVLRIGERVIARYLARITK